MKKHTATLLRDTCIEVTFESTDVQSGQSIGQHVIPHMMRSGVRGFKSRKAAQDWANHMNAVYGEGTASF